MIEIKEDQEFKEQEDEASENISDILARQKQKERGSLIPSFF